MPKSFFQNNKKLFSVKKINEILSFKALCFKVIFSLFFSQKSNENSKNGQLFLSIFENFSELLEKLLRTFLISFLIYIRCICFLHLLC